MFPAVCGGCGGCVPGGTFSITGATVNNAHRPCGVGVSCCGAGMIMVAERSGGSRYFSPSRVRWGSRCFFVDHGCFTGLPVGGLVGVCGLLNNLERHCFGGGVLVVCFWLGLGFSRLRFLLKFLWRV